MDQAIRTINNYAAEGSDVVANYVLRPQDYKRLEREVATQPLVVITLAPPLAVAQSNRGQRQLSEWEVARVKYRYDSGIASPNFGHIIDNSELTPQQTVDQITKLIHQAAR